MNNYIKQRIELKMSFDRSVTAQLILVDSSSKNLMTFSARLFIDEKKDINPAEEIFLIWDAQVKKAGHYAVVEVLDKDDMVDILESGLQRLQHMTKVCTQWMPLYYHFKPPYQGWA